MARKSITSRIFGIFDDFGAAFAVAGAVRNGRKPDARDLRRMGVDPEQFASIGK